MAFGLSAASVSMISAGAGLVGSMMQSDASGNAAGVQADAGRAAAEMQQKQYEQTRADLTPFRETGVQANNKLAQLLGLGGGSGGGGGGGGLSREQLRNQLIGQFTTTTQGTMPQLPVGLNSIAGVKDGKQGYFVENFEGGSTFMPMEQGTSGGTSIDETGLNAAIEAALAGQAPKTDSTADDFGMLLKKYTGQELLSDPGYLFRRSEGQKGVERSAAGRGGLFSGQAGKELERFNQGLASTEFQAGFNRDQAYKGQTYGMLSGTSGAGQNAANMTGTAGASAAAGAGNYLTQAANAQASGMVGGANAINSGIGNFQNYNMLNSIFNKTVQGGGTPGINPSEPYPGYNQSIGLTR